MIERNYFDFKLIEAPTYYVGSIDARGKRDILNEQQTLNIEETLT
jgi:hypothetical protein